MKILKIEGISKTLGKKKILNNVSLSVEEGQIFGFLGPNGAGKTTTIKMVMGLLSVDEGKILINDIDITKNFEKAISNVGGIIENPEMYAYLSGMQNLKLFARMHDNITQERIDEVVKIVKLENRINEKVKKYSLGMRQRLGIAQAILHKPNLLILDEPTNGLDPAGIKELRDTLHYLCENEDVAVIVSSHLLSEMELLCDSFGVIDNGVMVDFISTEDIEKENIDESIVYEIETSDNEKAREFVAKFVIENTDSKNIPVLVTKHQASILCETLLNNKIEVFALIPHKKSLEETFIEMTSGSKI